MSEFVRVEEGSAAGVATVFLERPPMNALSSRLVEDLAEATRRLQEMEGIRAIVIWGGPKIFAAGADIKEFLNRSETEAKKISQRMSEVFANISGLPQISIAAVNGYALGGGCELALSADFRVAGDDAVFGQPEILLGLIPGAGGTQRLPRLVGLSRAKEIIFSGRQVKAPEARAIGLADQVVPASDAYQTALRLARRYAAGPSALASAKRSISLGMDMPLPAALTLESEEFAAAFATEDARLGVASFLEKGPGKAEFSGR